MHYLIQYQLENIQETWLINRCPFRYERGVDPDLVNYALCRALDLILDLSGGKMDGSILKIEGAKVN